MSFLQKEMQRPRVPNLAAANDVLEGRVLVGANEEITVGDHGTARLFLVERSLLHQPGFGSQEGLELLEDLPHSWRDQAAARICQVSLISSGELLLSCNILCILG